MRCALSEPTADAITVYRVIVTAAGERHLCSGTHQWRGDPWYVVSACNRAWMMNEVAVGRPVKLPHLTCAVCDRNRTHPPPLVEPVQQTEACREYAKAVHRRGLYLG